MDAAETTSKYIDQAALESDDTVSIQQAVDQQCIQFIVQLLMARSDRLRLNAKLVKKIATSML